MHSDERDVQHRAQHDACTVARASDNVGKKLKTVGTCRVIAGYIWVTMSTQPSKRFAMVAAQQRAVQHCSAARILFSTTAPASTVRFDRRHSSLGRCSETRSLVLTRTLCRTRRSRGSRRKQTGSCETRGEWNTAHSRGPHHDIQQGGTSKDGADDVLSPPKRFSKSHRGYRGRLNSQQ